MVYEKKEKKSGKGQSTRNNLIDLFNQQEERVVKLRELINEYKKDNDEEVGKEAQKLYAELKKADKEGIKKNTYFKSKEGREEFPNDKFKRFSHPGDKDGLKNNVKLFTSKGMNDIISKHIFEGSNFERPVLRGKKVGKINLQPKPKKAESKEPPMATPIGDKEEEEKAPEPDPAQVKTDQDPEEGIGAKQGTLSELKDDSAQQKQELEVLPEPVAPPPSPEFEEARKRMDDFILGINADQMISFAETYEAGKASENQKDHREKEVHAWSKMQDYLGDGWKSLPKEDVELMHHFFYSETLHQHPPEADAPGEPEVNNDTPEFTPQNMDDFTQADIDSMNIGDDPPSVAPPDPQQEALSQATEPNIPTTQQMPEFRQFNPTTQNVNIEIDDTSPAGTTSMPQPVGAYTSSNIMNSINFPTDEAQKMIEDRMRSKKTIEQLKEEIRAMHLIYDDDIPQFKKNPHLGQKEDALKSSDLQKVKAHHESMQNTIRNYYKTSDLKVGVILSAESFFGSNFAAHPNLAALTQPRMPEYDTSRVRAVQPGHEFDNAVAGETRVNRLGRNYKKPVKRNVPKVGQPTMAQNIKDPKQVPDVERPLFSQRGYRQRRVNTNVGMPIKLKVSKK